MNSLTLNDKIKLAEDKKTRLQKRLTEIEKEIQALQEEKEFILKTKLPLLSEWINRKKVELMKNGGLLR